MSWDEVDEFDHHGDCPYDEDDTQDEPHYDEEDE